MILTNLDYSRIDGPLALACEETHASERSLTVFVHTVEPPTDEQAKHLSVLGVSVPTRASRIFTATLSPSQIAALSNEPWVKRLKLSQRLKMASG
ncbi:MAG: hypothetical protein EXS05_06035 [Planctomycetaceae bacterium]|nr:hypothetical protein [Planctomycetaceae bacterium]